MLNDNQTSLNRIQKTLFLVVAFCLLATSSASAATLSLSPSTTTLSAGNIVTIKILTNTLGVSINNAEATLQFPTDLLEVVSVSKAGSIFTLWVEDPSYSNASGKVSFNGGIASPGYSGSAGTIASVTFKAKKQGTASLLFTDAAVRQNDGLGTDVLSSKGSATIAIGGVEELPAAPVDEQPVTKNLVPLKPVVSSGTHPDQEHWYASGTASFDWKVPTGITSIQAQTNKTPLGIPTISYDNSVTQKTLTNLTDGVYYFHIRYANANGWSPLTHYTIRIDTTAPETFTPVVTTTGSVSTIVLDAKDATSGIEYYSVAIDGGDPLVVRKADLDTSSAFTLPPQKEGTHTVLVTAYDKAGNHTQATTTFTSSFISTPTLSVSPLEIQRGESVTVFGTSDYFNKQVEVIIESKGKTIKTYTQTIAPDGTFSVTTDRIKEVGTVSVSARTVLSATVKSVPSERIYITVLKSEIAKVSVALLWVVVALGLGLLLLIVLYIGWHKFLSLKKKNKKGLQHAIEDVHTAVNLLKEELNDQLVELEKIRVDRDLNKNEELIFKQIQKNISDVDAFIEKKLKKLL